MPASRTAIVTGAGKRVGAAIAAALIERGWTVLAHVHDAGDIVPEGAIKVVADLQSTDCARPIFHSAAPLPPVGLLVNNAARFAFDSMDAFSSDEFDAHMAINVRAPILLTEAFAKAVREQGERQDALVVNLLDSKLSAPNPDFLSYTLAKQALAGFTELAARALAADRIRVNGIAPALMLPSGEQSDANFARMHRANPLRRGVEPADVVAAIDYLLAAQAVTGEVLTIDGGQRFLGLPRDVQFLESE
jgi:NAD(P)-dependent dehydrogenase (short-subunit alcohol dehydrogenase family)